MKPDRREEFFPKSTSPRGIVIVIFVINLYTKVPYGCLDMATASTVYMGIRVANFYQLLSYIVNDGKNIRVIPKSRYMSP
ncbi:MAG TPA: hypothetical protein VF610_12285 [Segetibacter sp.]